MESSDSSATNGISRATFARGEELQAIIDELVAKGAPVYGPTAKAKDHRGYIGLVYDDGCIQRFSIDDGYKYQTRAAFIKSFKGKQLTCL